MPRFIYFDLGNVLLNFDHARAARQMAAVAGISAQLAWQVLFDQGLLWQYERGEISSREFCEAFCRDTGGAADPAHLLRACADIFELNASIIAVVTGLWNAGYPLGILSNTNEAHWQLVSDGRYRIIPCYFQQRILSYEARAMKPDPRIYQLAVQRTGMPAGDVFFVDDREENVSGACHAGMDAVLYRGVRQLILELHRRGVQFL
jgi:putative hydrolase of the HAD superfamily